MLSYARVAPRPPTRASYPPLLPIYPPPESALPNPLPRPRPNPCDIEPFPDSRYAASTHVVPAAYLRCTPPPSLPPPSSGPSAGPGERRAANKARLDWIHAQTQCVRGEHERVLWSVVKRYVRREGRGSGRTLFLSHANGFPKETWEPTLLDLFAGGTTVDEVWAWEATHHGASFVLNADAGILHAGCDWTDETRDMLNFLLHFLPSSAVGPEELPLHLPRVAATESALRQERGFSARTLFSVGHSYGGGISAWAALTCPQLFTALMLVDPFIVYPATMLSFEINAPSMSVISITLARRDSWPSREAARKSFRENPFFASWDARVLDAYVTHGLVSDASAGGDGTGPVRLSTPPLQEALVFAWSYTGCPVWDRLPALDPRIPLRWVVPERVEDFQIGEPGSTQERVWLRAENASNVRISRAGHLIPQQAPREMAGEIAAMLEGKIQVNDGSFDTRRAAL